MVTIFAALCLIYRHFFWNQDIRKYARVYEQCRNVIAKNDKIVYLGESSNNTYSKYDYDKRSISDMIADYYPSIPVGSIRHDAYQAEMYYALLKSLPYNNDIETVIVTVNLRSFGINWIESDLNNSLEQTRLFLNHRPPLFNRFLMAFKGYNIQTKQEQTTIKEAKKADNESWVQTIKNEGVKDSNGQKDSKKTELAVHYIDNQGLPIDTLTNPRIKDFDKIVTLAKKRGWNLIFNIVAENVDEIAFAGERLTNIVDSNCRLLIDRYGKNDVQVVNNLCEVKSDCFFDYWATEHYCEEGRKTIAKNVAEALRNIYSGAYVEPHYDYAQDSIYFNDCERETFWRPLETLTDERGHLSRQSCKVGIEDPYGITLELFRPQLPDSINKVDVSMYVYQKNLKHSAVLTMELHGEEFSALNMSIQKITKVTKEWTRIDYTFDVSTLWATTESIKVYVWNFSPAHYIFIDDIKIAFIR